MQRILVPCAGSANAFRAVRYASELAKNIPDARLDLLYVEDPVVMQECAHLSGARGVNPQCAAVIPIAGG